MDETENAEVGRVVLMWASQVTGKTETINNLVGHTIDIDPCPCLMIQPTLDMGETWSRDRLAPMLRDTPALRGKVKDPRSRDSGNKILSKRFPAGHITIAGANAPSGLASRPIRKVYFDEVDRYPASAGTEGDPIALAEKRTESFSDAVVIETSTPTLRGISRIEKSFEQSDKRFWFVEFPCCAHETNLRWEMIKWVDNDPKTTYLECPHCRAKLNDADRRLMVLNGEWKATAPFKNGIRGYHLNGLYCLFKAKKPYANRLEQMVAAFLKAKADGKEALKVWVNTFLAETWQDESEAIVAHEVAKRAEHYGPDLPPGVLVVTSAADVQRDRIEVFSMGHGIDREVWALDYKVLWGDPLKPDVWKELDKEFNRRFKTSSGLELTVAAATVDSGDGKTTDAVYAYTRPRAVRKIFATKGSSLSGLPIVAGFARARKRFPYYKVGTDTAKSEIYGRLKIEEKGPGFVHFPKGAKFGFDENFYVGLTCETPRREYKRGKEKIVWHKPQGARNEPLDLFVLNLVAIGILDPAWNILKRNLERKVRDYTLRTEEPDKAANKDVKPDAKKPPEPAPPPKKKRLKMGMKMDWRRF